MLTLKSSFLNELMALDSKEVVEVQKKLTLLTEDPTHAPPAKKRLQHVEGNLHRLRWKHIRVFYTYSKPYVSVLALRKRAGAYDTDLPEAEKLGGGEVDDVEESDFDEPPDPSQSWQRWLEPQEAELDTVAILVTDELLERLNVASEHRGALMSATTDEGLLEVESVPEDIRLRVFDAVLGRPLEVIQAQPDLLVDETDDLIRYRQGELLGFLLMLDQEQEKLVRWAVDAKGPTLIKGGPGTGKSTIALYRVRLLLKALRKAGVAEPRVLFTTYTNALVRFSEQLLRSLLGDDARLVDVRTADSVAVSLYTKARGRPQILSSREVDELVERAVQGAHFEGNSLVQAAQRRTIERLGLDYLADELVGVIEGRSISSLEEYRAAGRPGRRVPLNKTQRGAVWSVYEAFQKGVASTGKLTWSKVRAGAIDAVGSVGDDAMYDAVVVDEAQDLEPVALRMLVETCRQPNRLFLAADANQSIYGAGFRWGDVHESLRFQGRTGVLKANHRSTKEIGEAAQDYLGTGELDSDRERRYVHAGPLPAVRAIGSGWAQAKLVARFFRRAAKELRLGLGSCAALCPTNAGAKELAGALQELGVTAQFMPPKELDLSAPGVKTLTLKSAKGLEFPVVALAGFVGTKYPYVPRGIEAEEQQELFDRERRTMFVAMTRAMRALLIVVPTKGASELLQGFDERRWNLGEAT